MEHKKELQDYLDTLVARKGSDIHLIVGSKPLFRVNKELVPFIQKEVLTAEDTKTFFDLIIRDSAEEYKVSLQEKKHLLFSYQHETSANRKLNLRVTVYFEKKQIAIAIRLIQETERTIEDLNLPPILKTIMDIPRGLFLVVGPAGSGKSTTLAAMVNHCNNNQRKHILTIEDPIEFLFTNRKSIISQREVPVDSLNFETGLNTALRADADILMIGEMRSAETMQITMTAAEVGHLVLSTVHANNTAGTITRIVDSFPPVRQGQVSQQLAASLLGVCAITLLPRISGGLIPACEILLNSSAVANLIRTGKIEDIETILQTNRELGMMSLEHELARLVHQNEITLDTANTYSKDKKTLTKYL